MLYLKVVFLRIVKSSLFIIFFLLLISCGSSKSVSANQLNVRFLDDFVLEDSLTFQGIPIGGLSDVDFDGEHFYAICDQSSNPRIYRFQLQIKNKKIDTLVIDKMIKVTDSTRNIKPVDFEGIIANPEEKTFLVSSEGLINAGISAAILKTDFQGNIQKKYQLPSYFSTLENARNNGMFEALARDNSTEGFWVANELPLKNDGPKSTFFNRKSLVRFTKFSSEGITENQFAYRLNSISRIPILPFALNGLTAILNYAPQKFISVERSFSAGRGKKAYHVKLFLVDATSATKTLTLERLKKEEIKPAEKFLLFDFDDVRKKLTQKSIENIEGICFGPQLPNGNKTLLLIADNNFNSFKKQLNQVILMEIINP
ncbi:esterase-like activity of phytase family protein [Mesonia maritima]|uniref:Phytase-like domain-containing protein n=1 Tax=Mesonia maritima TaxID=1793873 RepID=A0ABU1K6U7_9FLAO|nr:esterase-like activity of phytase family protein [Mesonia maritima]MDR6300298.1 hypothetical protein [Mesonia maritima]